MELIYIVRYSYYDQYESVAAILGIYTDVKLAKAHRDKSAYCTLYGVPVNQPIPEDLANWIVKE